MDSCNVYIVNKNNVFFPPHQHTCRPFLLSALPDREMFLSLPQRKLALNVRSLFKSVGTIRNRPFEMFVSRY